MAFGREQLAMMMQAVEKFRKDRKLDEKSPEELVAFLVEFDQECLKETKGSPAWRRELMTMSAIVAAIESMDARGLHREFGQLFAKSSTPDLLRMFNVVKPPWW